MIAFFGASMAREIPYFFAEEQFSKKIFKCDLEARELMGEKVASDSAHLGRSLFSIRFSGTFEKWPILMLMNGTSMPENLIEKSDLLYWAESDSIFSPVSSCAPGAIKCPQSQKVQG